MLIRLFGSSRRRSSRTSVSRYHCVSYPRCGRIPPSGPQDSSSPFMAMNGTPARVLRSSTMPWCMLPPAICTIPMTRSGAAYATFRAQITPAEMEAVSTAAPRSSGWPDASAHFSSAWSMFLSVSLPDRAWTRPCMIPRLDLAAASRTAAEFPNEPATITPRTYRHRGGRAQAISANRGRPFLSRPMSIFTTVLSHSGTGAPQPSVAAAITTSTVAATATPAYFRCFAVLISRLQLLCPSMETVETAPCHADMLHAGGPHRIDAFCA